MSTSLPAPKAISVSSYRRSPPLIVGYRRLGEDALPSEPGLLSLGQITKPAVRSRALASAIGNGIRFRGD